MSRSFSHDKCCPDHTEDLSVLCCPRNLDPLTRGDMINDGRGGVGLLFLRCLGSERGTPVLIGHDSGFMGAPLASHQHNPHTAQSPACILATMHPSQFPHYRGAASLERNHALDHFALHLTILLTTKQTVSTGDSLSAATTPLLGMIEDTEGCSVRGHCNAMHGILVVQRSTCEWIPQSSAMYTPNLIFCFAGGKTILPLPVLKQPRAGHLLIPDSQARPYTITFISTLGRIIEHILGLLPYEFANQLLHSKIQAEACRTMCCNFIGIHEADYDACWEKYYDAYSPDVKT